MEGLSDYLLVPMHGCLSLLGKLPHSIHVKENYVFFSAEYALDEKGGAEKCRHFLLSKNTIGISQLYIHAA